jgi:hypothetical protein
MANEQLASARRAELRGARPPNENKRTSGLLQPFLGNPKKERRCTNDMI